MTEKNNRNSEASQNFAPQKFRLIFLVLLFLSAFQFFLSYRIFSIFSGLVRNGTISGLPFLLGILGNLSLYLAAVLVFIRVKPGKFFFAAATIFLAGTFLTQGLVFDPLSYPVLLGCMIGFTGWWISKKSLAETP